MLSIPVINPLNVSVSVTVMAVSSLNVCHKRLL